MQGSKFIKEKIKENAVAKINYRSDFDGKSHYIRGFLIGETERFFQVEGKRYHDLVAVPKTGIVSMIFEKPKEDQKPKPTIKPDPVTKPYSKKKEEFSYDKWWGHDSIKEAKK